MDEVDEVTTRPAGTDQAGAAEVTRTGDEPAGVPGGNRPSLTRITVNLQRRAVDALATIVAHSGGNKTDVINRALVVYQLVLELRERSGGQLVFQDREGHTERIHLL